MLSGGKHWRSIGIPGIMFLDDGGFFDSDYESALENINHVRSDLINCNAVFSRILRDSIAHYVGLSVGLSVGGLAVSSYIYINEQMHIF